MYECLGVTLGKVLDYVLYNIVMNSWMHNEPDDCVCYTLRWMTKECASTEAANVSDLCRVGETLYQKVKFESD